VRERFGFLRGAILDVMAAPGEPGPVGVLLRLLQYYEEMASARRDVDRDYKRRARHRNASGRVALSLPLGAEPSGPGGGSSGDLFEEIGSRLCESRRVSCACAGGGDWGASLSGGGSVVRGDVEILAVCRACGFSEEITVSMDEFERVAHEVRNS
jgi:hypothetical protein